MESESSSMNELHLTTLDPAHFHAALVQKEAIAGVVSRVHVYAPLGPDLLAHLQRLIGFNSRGVSPTSWQAEVHAGPDYLERFAAERPGDLVVLAGRNRRKIEYLEAAVAAGVHVLADKPWIIRHADFPRLVRLLEEVERRNLVVFDIMTERHEITSILQRELVQDTEVFGGVCAGSEREPAVYMESVHFLKKSVAGAPLRRPAWFFDTAEQGEGLTDVGTHLVDLVPWLLWPGQRISYEHDGEITSGRRWPTIITLEQFEAITGERVFPSSLQASLRSGKLEYMCNNFLAYRLRGVHVALNILWDVEAKEGGDTHRAILQGQRSRLEIRQGKEENWRAELYVMPQQPADATPLASALRHRVERLQARFPGLALAPRDGGWQLLIPDAFRVGHEAHFAEVTHEFLRYVRREEVLPAWENPNLLAKYWVTTRGAATCASRPVVSASS